jgi:hypothetical protein
MHHKEAAIAIDGKIDNVYLRGDFMNAAGKVFRNLEIPEDKTEWQRVQDETTERLYQQYSEIRTKNDQKKHQAAEKNGTTFVPEAFMSIEAFRKHAKELYRLRVLQVRVQKMYKQAIASL